MNSSAKSTVSHARIYGLGAILKNVVSFIMLPIYTRCLAPADYGTIELLSMLLDVVGLVVGLRIEDAIFKFYYQAKNPKEKNLVISNALVAAIAANVLGSLFILVFSRPLTLLMFGSVDNYMLTAIFGLTLMFQSLISVPMAYIRIQQKPWLYISMAMMRLVLQLSLNIYFVVMKGMKVEGVVYSAVISTSLVGFVSLFYMFRYVGFATDKSLMKKMLIFSFPLILGSVAAFYSTFADRYFLRVYVGLAEVGIYSLAYKFGFLLMALVWEPFSKIWDVRRYELLERADSEETYNDNFIVMIGLLIFGALGISIFIKEALMILSGREYWAAATVAPIVLLAYIVMGLANFNYFPLLARGSTKDIARSHWLCAALITVGYLTLIPAYGMYGAAWATMLGFLAQLIWLIYRGRMVLDMQLSWLRVGLLLLSAVALYAVSYFVSGSLIWCLLAKSVLICIYLGLLWWVANTLQRNMMLSFFRG